ncbi:kinase-like domain-containing protein [Mycena maculata]|uniref:Kinase-like domain-containing protein n=1 Tax=Mycena maculata TaxID=230809 RepID=A0AAD7NQ39_9AGAR|nr:kinase-like domain-containing protein [Mycena maculata]
MVYRCGTVVLKYDNFGDLEGQSEVERVWAVMHLAGDCCVRTGRLFRSDHPAGPKRLAGFCMPMETPIVPATIANKEERLRLIYQVRDLVAKLHSKNIVHGDLKPQNLLKCSEGSLRLCDFDNASVEGDGYVNPAMTIPYCSQFRFRYDSVPMTRAEDTYALGLTIWELYTGRTPLTYGDESMEDECVQQILENRVNVGMRPDMALIDDLAVRGLIDECLAAAPECPNVFWRDELFCVETRLEFNRCLAKPRHLYSRIVHRTTCRHPNGPCEDPYVDPKIYPSPLDPVCVKCEPGVEYLGIPPQYSTPYPKTWGDT